MFWKKRPTSPPAAPAAAPPQPPPERRFTDRMAQAETVIGPGLRLVGEIRGGDSIEIGGVVEGRVATKSLCRVRSTGQLRGRLSAGFVIVEGRIDGRISARRKVELRGTAHVKSDIHAEGVAIAEGCFFDGRIHMAGGEGAAQESFKEKRRPHPP
jgi:cytoskeletal protein CcmA (bactofilin family)